MNGLFSLVGRAGFEPATNGLKARYALRAEGRFPPCAPLASVARSGMFCALCAKNPQPPPPSGLLHPLTAPLCA